MRDGAALAIFTGILCVSVPAALVAQPGGTATPLPLASSAPNVYSVDGVDLGSKVTTYISQRGTPNAQLGFVYAWTNRRGGVVSVRTNSDGIITIVDVKAGKGEVRSVDVLGRLARFNDGGHINEPPPIWVNYVGGDSCSPSLVGSPCETFLLPGNAELVMNFGGDNGMADWDLTEVIVGNRAALLESGTVIKPAGIATAGPISASRMHQRGQNRVFLVRNSQDTGRAKTL